MPSTTTKLPKMLKNFLMFDLKLFFTDSQSFQAGEARWFFTDESVFTRIMAHRSWMQIRRIAAAYENISGMTLMMAINEECSGETERAYKAIVRMACDPCWYFTRNIFKV